MRASGGSRRTRLSLPPESECTLLPLARRGVLPPPPFPAEERSRPSPARSLVAATLYRASLTVDPPPPPSLPSLAAPRAWTLSRRRYAQNTWDRSPWETVEITWSASAASAASSAFFNPWDLCPAAAPSAEQDAAEGDEAATATAAAADEEERAAWGDAIASSSLCDADVDPLLEVIDDVMEMACADHFVEAVPLDDEQAAPGYDQKIPVPMHLKLVRERLASGYYRTVAAVCADVELIALNCVRYNRADAAISKSAHEMCTEILGSLRPGAAAYDAAALEARVLLDDAGTAASSFTPDRRRPGGAAS